MEKRFKLFQLIVIVLFLIVNNIPESNGKSIVVSPKNPRIIIIGAGAAGIAAASKLFEYGFTNVTILEAEDRIGGRVHTVKFGNYSVDLGGQWIHGQEGNVAFNLANPLDLVEVNSALDYTFNHDFLDSNGNTLDEDLSRRLENFQNSFVYDVQFDNNTEYESVGEYVNKMFEKEFKDKPEILNKKTKFLKTFEASRISFDSAQSWNDISALGDGYKILAGDQTVNWKERGYSTILDILMRRYPNPDKELPVLNNTVLNTEVISIDYMSDEEGPSILVTTKNGQLYKADHVIVTVSLGVLKEKHKTLFIPPLPEKKTAAIEAIGFGSIAKIFLLFDKPFWKLGKEKVQEFSFVWNDEDRKKIEADPERKWLLGMYGSMTVEHKPNALLLWNTGPYSKMMEAIPEEKVFKYTVENLHRFFDKIYNVSDPVAMIRSHWYTNSHFRGTYSYRSVAAYRQKLYSTTLEEPLNDERILFAGEATAKDRFSTVDGAIGSGWKAADRLIEHYQILPRNAPR